MITSRNLIWIIPFLLFLSFPLLRIPTASFLTPRGGYDSSLEDRQLDAHNFVMDGVYITQSEDGKTNLEISADRAYTGATPEEFRLEEVDAVITGKDGEQTFITARQGILYKATSILTLKREVVIMKPKDKFELYTELLIYNEKTHIANSPGKTQILGEKIEVTGHTLVYNNLTSAYDLGGRVRVRLANFVDP